MTSDYVLRLFEPTLAEYEAIVEVYNAENPQAVASAVSWRHWDKHRDPARLFTRYVVVHGETIGGYGFSLRTDVVADKFRFAGYFLSGWETADLVCQFYAYMMAHCLAHNPTAFICQVREDELGKIRWLEGEGFWPVMRYPRSVLTVADCEPTICAGLEGKMAAEGIEIVSLAALAEREPDWQRRVYELEMLLSQDVPQPVTFSRRPFAQYAQRVFDSPDLLSEGWFVALAGDDYVGMTNLFKSGTGVKLLETGLTGVHRGYRRRGVARALKCQAIAFAQRLGATYIQTYNEENNPMFALNVQLGFQPQPAVVDWEKVLVGG